MDQLNFKAGEVIIAIIGFPGRGRYLVRGTVRYEADHPGYLWVGSDMIAHHGGVPSWITVLPADVAAEVADLEQAAAVTA